MVSEKEFKAFVGYCVKEVLQGADIEEVPQYHSLSCCILDCIYSLRARYYSVTIPVVRRYAEKYSNTDMYSMTDTLDDFVKHIEDEGGVLDFTTNVLHNKQILSGVLKGEVCQSIANKLININIHTLKDFQQFQNKELLESVLYSVKGVGYDAVNYLFMLTADPDRCKPDVHLHEAIREAIGHGISNEECQQLMTATVKLLPTFGYEVTVAQLDHLIWLKYASKPKSKK